MATLTHRGVGYEKLYVFQYPCIRSNIIIRNISMSFKLMV